MYEVAFDFGYLPISRRKGDRAIQAAAVRGQLQTITSCEYVGSVTSIREEEKL